MKKTKLGFFIFCFLLPIFALWPEELIVHVSFIKKDLVLKDKKTKETVDKDGNISIKDKYYDVVDTNVILKNKIKDYTENVGDFPFFSYYVILPHKSIDVKVYLNTFTTDKLLNKIDEVLTPFESVKINPPDLFLGYELYELEICPFTYDSVKNDLDLMAEMEIKIKYITTGDKVILEPSEDKKEICKKIAKGKILNPEYLSIIAPQLQKIDYKKIKIFNKINDNSVSYEEYIKSIEQSKLKVKKP